MSWKDKALKHAKEFRDKEVCGLVAIIKGKKRYIRCENKAERPEDLFIISPENWADVEDQGEIVSIFHSHPTTSPEPSQADRVACEKTGIEWWIVNPNIKKWGRCEPCGYIAPLVGRTWIWGVTDCWSLCRDWYQEELGIALRDWDRPFSSLEFVINPMFDRCWRDTGFRELLPTEELEKGDLVLMSVGSPGLNHIGVYLSDQLILHHLENRLSSRDFYGEWLLKCTGRRIRYDAA